MYKALQVNKNKKCAKKTSNRNILMKKVIYSFICFLCFWSARRKENRKQKIQEREKSLQCNVNVLGALGMQMQVHTCLLTLAQWDHNQLQDI